jgi:hypothetical protein
MRYWVEKMVLPAAVTTGCDWKGKKQKLQIYVGKDRNGMELEAKSGNANELQLMTKEGPGPAEAWDFTSSCPTES